MKSPCCQKGITKEKRENQSRAAPEEPPGRRVTGVQSVLPTLLPPSIAPAPAPRVPSAYGHLQHPYVTGGRMLSGWGSSRTGNKRSP